jgi:hypothetical protein
MAMSMTEAEKQAAGIVEFDVPSPDPDFDPRTALPGEIARRGLPARPDPDAEPELFELWESLFTARLTYHRPDFDFDTGLSRNYLRADPAPAVARRQASRNWSGAYIGPRDGRMFVNLVGVWRVPRVQPPRPGDGDFRSSTWIGLDGQRKYPNSTLPQIGTAQQVKVVAGVPTYYYSSWVQWWPTIPPFTILTINPGDLVVAWLTVLNLQLVYLAIINLSAITYSSFNWGAPTIPWPNGGGPIQVEVSGATAEWVMERPMVWGSDVLYELPDYFPTLPPTVPRDPVTFICFATSAPAPGVLGRTERLVGPGRIRMFEILGDEHRTRTISVGSRPDTPSLRQVDATYVLP